MALPKLKLVLVAVAVVLSAVATVLVAQSRQTREQPAHAAHADESAGWYCPMHLHVTSDHEGSCPICGMDLVQRVQEPADEPAGWYCPMHLHVTSDHAGSCPICGMDLVQRTQEPANTHTGAVAITPQMQARLGVVTQSVQPVDFSPSAAVAAQVIADERRAVTLSPKVEGWVTRLGVAGIGQPVRAGQVLYEIYSPELQQRQKDYIDLLTRRDSLLAAKGGESGMTVGNTAPDLMLASVARERFRVRNRLIAADVPLSVLDDLERFRRIHDVVPVSAMHDGVVTSIGAREGAFVRPGEFVVSYADRHAAWAEIILTPDLLSQIRPGDTVELHSTFDYGAVVTSPLDPTLAVVDPVSRTARLRVPLSATANQFLPGTLLDGRIRMTARRSLTIPVDTVLRTGRGDFVIVAESENHFRPAPVRLGAESGDRIEVLEGLNAGQTVVANGQFMLSAESSLQSSWNRFAAATPHSKPADIELATADSPGHSQHSGHSDHADQTDQTDHTDRPVQPDHSDHTDHSGHSSHSDRPIQPDHSNHEGHSDQSDHSHHGHEHHVD